MKRLVLAGVVALAVTACAPPFLADLNRAAALTGHMTMVGTVGAVSLGTASNVRFYPVKQAASSLSGLNIQSGFIVSDNGSGSDNLQFVFTDSNGTQTIGSSTALPVSSSSYPVYDYDVTTPTASGTATILVVSWPNNSYYALSVALPNGPFSNPAATPLTGVFSPLVAGVQMVPQPGMESFNFLVASGTLYSNGPATLTGSTLTAGAPTSYSTLPVSPTRATYGVAPNGTGYASYYNGTSWVCYEMTTSTVTLLPGVTNRLDTVLTSGDLLSTQDGTLRLYDSSGSQIYAVPLNGLQYCYEMYVGGTPYVFFSLPITIPHNNMAFNTYAIPTSSMPNLGK